MALNTRAALLAALLGSTVPAAALWAQTTPATPETPAATTDTPAATGSTATPSTSTDATPSTSTDATPSTDAAPSTSTDTAPSTSTDTAPAASTDATPATTPDAAPAGAPATPAATATPNAGGPVPPAASAAEAQVGGFYIDSTQGDWQIRCQKTEAGQDPCELYQLLRDDKNNPVAEVSLIPLTGQAAAGVTLVAPLETDLLPGLGFKVDSGKAIAYPFSFCAPIGCFSRVAMNQGEVDSLRRGSAATVTLVPYGAPQGTKVDLGLSLKGFTAGWDAVKAKAPVANAQQGPATTATPSSTPTPNPAPPVTPPAN